MSLGPVVVRKTLAEQRSRVWQMLSDSEQRALWWRDANITFELGGKVTVGEALSGTVDVLVSEQTLGYRVKDSKTDSETGVLILLRPEDENYNHTVVTVIESGFAGHANASQLIFEAETGWNVLFGALEQAVAGEEVTLPEGQAQEALSAENGAEDSVEEAEVVEEAEEAEESVEVDAEATADVNEDAELTESELADSELPESEVADETENDEAEVTPSEATQAGTEDAEFEDAVVEDPVVEDPVVEDADIETVETVPEQQAVLLPEPETVVVNDPEPVQDSQTEDDSASNYSEEPLILPLAPDHFLQPEPEDDLGENDFTGEVPITIFDTGGVEATDIVEDIIEEEGALTEWEKLLRGEED